MYGRRGEGLITGLLSILIILIFSVTTYFCLDIFEIIDVPEKYSIGKLFGSKVEEYVAAEPMENVTPVSNLDDKSTVEELTNITENNSSEVSMPSYINDTQKQNQSADIGENYNRFYYNQLDEYAKTIYDKLYENKDKLKTGKYIVQFGTTFDDLLHMEGGSQTLSNSFQFAVNALIFDNPDIFYIDITKIYLLTETTTTIFKKTYKVSVGNSENQSYLSSEFSTEAIANAAILRVSETREIIKNQTYSDNIELKIRMVHDYLVKNIEYDETLSRVNIYNIYGALINKVAVCEGYAKAFKYILDDLGIPCIIVCGTATNSNNETENHAWNYVKINGGWYAVDVTWDDPIIIGNGTVRDDIKYGYYLKGSNNFFKDHKEDGNIILNSNFVYPKLNYYDY